MARQIEFFYDYLSPFSYLADTQLPALAATGTYLLATLAAVTVNGASLRVT